MKITAFMGSLIIALALVGPASANLVSGHGSASTDEFFFSFIENGMASVTISVGVGEAGGKKFIPTGTAQVQVTDIGLGRKVTQTYRYDAALAEPAWVIVHSTGFFSRAEVPIEIRFLLNAALINSFQDAVDKAARRGIALPFIDIEPF